MTTGPFIIGFVAFAAAAVAVGCGTASSPAEAPLSAEQVADLCANVGDDEARSPSFLATANVSGVRPFMGEHQYIKFTEPELRGADILLRSSPGLTRQWVSRVLHCHVARHGFAGTTAPDSVADPFVLETRPDLVVLETQTGFVVRVAGHDRGEGVEILRRAKLLVYGPAAPAVN